MIKRAGELRVASRNKRAIQFVVKEVLGAMQSEMVEANKDGRNNIIFHVPKTYSTVGDDPDMILMITTNVLRELLNADYDVKVRDLAHAYMFDIRWETDLTYADKKNMTDFLKKYIVGD